jgi:hypothetical protein
MCGVIHVAARTASRYCGVHVALVTGVTFERRMSLRQLQTGVACMIKCCRAPTGSDVAARAIAAVAIFVHIIGAMTGDAIAATRTAKVSNFSNIAAAMAILASQALVAASESKAGDRQVTENRLVPTLGVMAVRALTTVTTRVRVVCPVARYARPVDRRERVSCMAGGTA